MKISNFHYTLPPERIAQNSITPRDHSRLLVMNGATGTIQHCRFDGLTAILRKGDVVVINNSKVLPARLEGIKSTGGRAEILLVRDRGRNRWTAMLKNVSHRETGKTISVGRAGELTVHALQPLDEGLWIVRLAAPKGKRIQTLLRQYGSAPTPPYVTARHTLDSYQTVYAKTLGSIAAPTAGFHFSKPLISALKKKGVTFCPITLHVGPGTFLPIREENISRHRMHAEISSISARSAAIINAAKKDGRRVIAVGTTAVRTLESFADVHGLVSPGTKDTDLFIVPGYQFKMVDSIITNFHLPRTTLLLLVCAFAEWKRKGGTKRVLTAYQKAIRKKYRFYSFGDAMCIQ